MAGSLRSGSFNKKLVQIASAGAKAAGAETTFVDLRDYAMPIYDGDLEEREGLPPAARKLKDVFHSHSGLLIASPEYNSSISAVLKNTIDWLSRPAPGEKPLGCFVGKVCGLMAASPGALGGLRGLVHLRAILGNIEAIVLPQQVAVMKAHEAFDDAGKLKDAAVQANVEAIGAAVARVAAKLG